MLQQLLLRFTVLLEHLDLLQFWSTRYHATKTMRHIGILEYYRSTNHPYVQLLHDCNVPCTSVIDVWKIKLEIIWSSREKPSVINYWWKMHVTTMIMCPLKHCHRWGLNAMWQAIIQKINFWKFTETVGPFNAIISQISFWKRRYIDYWGCLVKYFPAARVSYQWWN